MRFISSKLILTAAMLVAAAFTTNSAMAATTVKVPFSFTVAGKILPAGNYVVKHDSTGSFVTLQSRQSSQSFTWVLGPGYIDSSNRKVVLRFDDRDQIHALESIQFGSMITAKLDNPSRNNERASAWDSNGR